MDTTSIDPRHETFRTRLFRTRLFGFDRAEVRAGLSSLLAKYEQKLKEVESLTRELSRQQLGLALQETPQQKEMAHLVERTLSSAHRVADEVRKEAEQEAARLIADAETRVARLVELAAADATATNDAAVVRLREVERGIEEMQMRHREFRSVLESMVTALGKTLADVSNVSVPDATEHAEAHSSPLEVTDVVVTNDSFDGFAAEVPRPPGSQALSLIRNNGVAADRAR